MPSKKKPSKPLPKVPAQRIRKMVFRGGGTKGLEHLGSIKELEQNGAWQDVREVWGSSAGGIVSMLAGLGMSSAEIEAQMRQINFADFMDKDVPFWSEALGIKSGNLLEKLESVVTLLKSTGHGLYKGDAFADYAKLLIAARTGNPNITFRELHEAATNPESPMYDPRFKDIMLTGSKIGPPPPELRLFNWKTTPDMPVWKAVRITMSFPGAFKAVEHEGEIFVDGGLKDNLPINPAIDFPSEDDDYHLRTTSDSGVIAVSMEDPATIEYLQGHRGKQHLGELGALAYGKQLAMAPLANVEVLRRHQDKIIMPNDFNQSTLNFTMSEADKQKLLTEGHRAAAEKLGKRPDWTRPGKPATYQDYHNNEDISFIIDQWEDRRDLLIAKAKAEATGKPFVKILRKIDLLEDKYGDFFKIIDRVVVDPENPDNAQIRAALTAFFAKRETMRKQAIRHADARMKVTQDAISLMHTKERLDIVGEILTEYTKKEKEYETLIAHYKSVSKLNHSIQEMIQAANTREIQQACANLEVKIQYLYAARTEHDDSREFDRIILQITSQFKRELVALGLNKAQVTNFAAVLKTYGDHFNANKFDMLPPLLQQEPQQFLIALSKKSEELAVQAQTLKSNIQQLEIDCYRNGMQILHPEKTDELVKTPIKNCTIKNLRVVHQQLQEKYDLALRTGKIHEIATAISPMHYQNVLKAKKAVTEAINKNTSLIVKFADLLQTHCTWLYKGFHFLASLNPISSYNMVVTMREVRENLQRIQERLETQPNISAYDEVSQNYIHAIESINEKLHDTTISQSEKIKYGKELNTLVHNFEKHQKKASQKKINPQTSVPKFKPPEITSD